MIITIIIIIILIKIIAIVIILIKMWPQQLQLLHNSTILPQDYSARWSATYLLILIVIFMTVIKMMMEPCRRIKIKIMMI